MIWDNHFSPAMERIFAGEALSVEDLRSLMTSIMGDKMSEGRVAAVLTSLRFVPLTWEMLFACAQIILREYAVDMPSFQSPIVQISATAYESKLQLSISTLAGILVAAAGVSVAQFGARSLAGKASGPNTLDSLSVPLAHSPEHVRKDLDEIGISFLYSTSFYPALKHLNGVRRSLGFRTIFDLIFPLLNPVKPSGQMLGVYQRSSLSLVARSLVEFNRQRAVVVHSDELGDALSLSGTSSVSFVDNGVITEIQLDPRKLGLITASSSELALRAGEDSDSLFVRTLTPEDNETSALQDLVCYNAALAYWCGSTSTTLESSLEHVRESLRSGAALEKLRQWQKVRRSHEWQRITCY